MNRREIVKLSIDTARSYLNMAEEMLDKDENLNSMVYLRCAGVTVLSCMEGLLIAERNPL
jgi:hypothetical protein